MEIVKNVALILLYIAWAIVVVCIVSEEKSIIKVILGAIVELGRYWLYWYIIARFGRYPVWSYLFAVVPAALTIMFVLNIIVETLILYHVVPRKLNSDIRIRVLDRLFRSKAGNDLPLSDALVDLFGRDLYDGAIRNKKIIALKATLKLVIKGIAITAALFPVIVKYLIA